MPLPLEMVRAPEGVEQDEGEVHLAAWHLQRLMDFSTSPAFDGEGGISLLAFETVPLLLEARAIRRAVSVFNALPSRSHLPPKAFFISFVFPRVNEGTDEEAVRFPDPTGEMKGLGVKEQAFGVVSAALQDEEGLAMPGGMFVLFLSCLSPAELTFFLPSSSRFYSSPSVPKHPQRNQLHLPPPPLHRRFLPLNRTLPPSPLSLCLIHQTLSPPLPRRRRNLRRPLPNMAPPSRTHRRQMGDARRGFRWGGAGGGRLGRGRRGGVL